MVNEEPLAWVRTDGQSGRANPALVDQFAADRAACGIAQGGDNNALRGAEPCMRQRGYVLGASKPGRSDSGPVPHGGPGAAVINRADLTQ